MAGWLEFEKPLLELEQRIDELRSFADGQNIDVARELSRLESKAEDLRRQIYGKLTRWQVTQIARHPRRPYTLDYLRMLGIDFMELHGDRRFGDDGAMVAGLGFFGGRKVVVVGHQKGRDTKENILRYFGSAHPEGARKALRLMRLAAKFGRPIISFVDTPGAWPGIGAEERGQGEAIATNLLEMSRLPVPIVVVVIGEGGSGGALAIGVGDRVLMLEYSVYSVISPEGCASILFRDAARASEAAEAMKITARDLQELGVIDEIVPEPGGGAHRDPARTARNLGEAIERHLTELERLSPAELVRGRLDKFMAMGEYKEG
uniref:Acetyl-coenzyme A carboxylase carboxyl transferase subunit alpha n=1 Tax=uncultured Latescibacterota bacterium TaxID=199737 RepID=Q2Z0E5_9BACT|nr:Acetyl-CoA carboxylase, alpha subunit [uncultured Latescibacterota bacterium]